MSHNKSKSMQRACYLLAEVLEIDARDPHALPGSVVGMVKDARRVMLADIRKRRDGRKREVFKRS